MREFKIVLLGGEGSGKTQLFHQLQDPPLPFTQQYRNTIGMDVYTNNPKNDKETMKLTFLDTSYSILDSAVDSAFIKSIGNANLYIICIDITNPDALAQAKKYIETFELNASSILIAATKTDLVDERKISEPAIQNFMAEYHIKGAHIETSAKIGTGIHQSECLNAIIAAVNLIEKNNNESINSTGQSIETKQSQYIENLTLEKIDSALTTLENNINQIDHYVPEASNTAKRLLQQLTTARTAYMNDLLSQSDNILAGAGSSFRIGCQIAINAASPVLKRDLNWGDYLTNLLKTLSNAVIWTVTFGRVHSFFSMTKSLPEKAVEQFNQAIKPC